MDTPVTRAEHNEFRKVMEAENRRLSDEDKRQNHRIDELESEVRQIGQLTTSVEKLAVSMESMVREQEQQGRRLEALEGRDEVNALGVSMERIAANMENARVLQEQQGKRLEALEQRDGEMWRKVIGHAITAVISIVAGFIFAQIGM